MDSYEAWLAAMPVGGVQERIGELEQELAVLRLLARKRGQAVGEPPTSTVIQQPNVSGHPVTGRMSPVREAIAAQVATATDPDGASPAEVARALGKSQNSVQTAMSRMMQAGQLVKGGPRRYKLPSTTSADAPEADTPPPQSGSGVEAMEP